MVLASSLDLDDDADDDDGDDGDDYDDDDEILAGVVLASSLGFDGDD